MRSELARACRIALMEATESVSVETIYDRIERRESFSLVGYKHPFRAIVLAMSAMVKRLTVLLMHFPVVVAKTYPLPSWGEHPRHIASRLRFVFLRDYG